MQDRQDSIPEETSASIWAIPMFIVVLVLFMISFGFNISIAVRFCPQRHAASQSGMGPDTVTNEVHEITPLADLMGVEDDTEGKEDCNGVQEQGTDSNEVMTENDDTEVKNPY
ncbi:hypothetical protein CHS0354_042982 [Potamilus streckersoni]|uniref:Uncharacterized protein n=1 Tax=Potamilus streckersoni TaxID=2493646 RepID=A0AAE0W6C7_9BIVA|nr:hypothetical protein CHS0354_042982 [Potamilus streckersoni]